MTAERLRPSLIVWIVSLLSATALAGQTEAAPCAPDGRAPATAEIPDALIDELVGWIALNTTYDVSVTYRSPPEVLFCDTRTTVPYDDGLLHVEPMLDAAYDLQRRRIYLVRPWSPKEELDVSVLLHELIHDVQHLNREWECIGAPEFEAYWLQDKWLHERGLTSRFNWSAILLLSTCPEAE